MDNTGMLFSLSIMSDCLQPPRLLCSLDFPAKNAGVGCHFHLQGIFPTQGSNPRLLQIPNRWAGVCGSSCGPGVKTPHFQGKRHRFDPWLGNWDPTCHMALIKKKKRSNWWDSVFWLLLSKPFSQRKQRWKGVRKFGVKSRAEFAYFSLWDSWGSQSWCVWSCSYIGKPVKVAVSVNRQRVRLS